MNRMSIVLANRRSKRAYLLKKRTQARANHPAGKARRNDVADLANVTTMPARTP